MNAAQLDKALGAVQASGINFTLRELRIFISAPPYKADAIMGVRDFSKSLNINKPSVSRAVSMLLGNGLLTRADDMDDRRHVIIHRSKAGDALAMRILKAAA